MTPPSEERVTQADIRAASPIAIKVMIGELSHEDLHQAFARHRHADKPAFSHWLTIKTGLRCWSGRRYRDGIGEYWQIGGLEVPVDGRDKMRRSKW